MASLGLERRPFVSDFSVFSIWWGLEMTNLHFELTFNSSQEAANFPAWKINVLVLPKQHFNPKIITQKV